MDPRESIENFLPNYEEKKEEKLQLKCVKCDNKFIGVKYRRLCNSCRRQINNNYWEENYVQPKAKFTNRD